MSISSPILASAAVLVLSSFAAQAATLSEGTFKATGEYDASGEGRVTTASTIDTTSSIILQTSGSLTDAQNLSAIDFDLDFGDNVGASFDIFLDGEVLTFTITEETFAAVVDATTDSPTGRFDISGNMSITGSSIYDDSTAFFTYSSSSTYNEGTYSLTVVTPATAVPVPAAGLMLVGGLGALGIASRRKKA